jgi:hypothetical protein
VTVQAPGFEAQIVEMLNLEVGRTVVRDFQLRVGDMRQEMTVTSDASSIEEATTSVGQVARYRRFRSTAGVSWIWVCSSVTPPQNGFLTSPTRGQGSFTL